MNCCFVVILLMWNNIRTKYLHTLFATGVAGIWGLLIGKEDWTTLFVSSKVLLTLAVYISLIFFGILTIILTTIQKRKEEFETLKRAHGRINKE